MSQASSIEWTDATWNPVRGCTKVSPGCKHCYAETFAERWRGVKGHPYEQGFDLRLVPEKLAEPLSWRKPRRVFVNSMSDLFHEDVPNEYIAACFGVMALARSHTFQVLTKRADRMRAWFEWYEGTSGAGAHPEAAIAAFREVAHEAAFVISPPAWPLPNVWLGVSAEDQERADGRIPDLLETPAAVHFVSAEPLLGAVDLGRWLGIDCRHEDGYREHDTNAWVCHECDEAAFLDWVIVGGESGPGARPFDVQWARRIVSDCRSAYVPCFVKQLGAKPFVVEGGVAALNWMPNGRDGVGLMDDCGFVHLHNRKGGDPAEWPAELRVRQFPELSRS